MKRDMFRKNLLIKTIGTMLFLSLTILLIAGCSPKAMEEESKVLEVKEETDKDVEAIQTVIEKEFSGPDKEYRELRRAVMLAQNEIADQEGFDALMEEPVYKNYTAYMEDIYASHFTENGFVNFVNTTPAFMYSVFDGDYKLAPSDIEITQNDQEPTMYNFMFNVEYTNEEAETTNFGFEGKAMVPEEGKIGTIQFEDKDGLQVKLNEAN